MPDFQSIRFQPSRPLLREISAERLNLILQEIKRNKPLPGRGITVRQTGQGTAIDLAATVSRGGSTPATPRLPTAHPTTSSLPGLRPPQHTRPYLISPCHCRLSGQINVARSHQPWCLHNVARPHRHPSCPLLPRHQRDIPWAHGTASPAHTIHHHPNTAALHNPCAGTTSYTNHSHPRHHTPGYSCIQHFHR